MGPLKNTKHEAFVLGIFNGKGQQEAYLDAGYKCTPAAASVAAHRLLTDPNIQARLDTLKGRVAEKLAQKVVITRAWVLDKLRKNALIAVGDEKVKISRPVKSRTKNEDGSFTETVETVEVEVSQRDGQTANRALELLGREADEGPLFVERKEIGQPGDFDDRSDDDLRDEAAAILGTALPLTRHSRRAGAPRGKETLQ